VRAFALGPLRSRHFSACNADYLERNLDLAKLRALIMPVMTIVGPIGALLTLYFGGKMVSTGEFTLGELVAFTAYLAQLVMPTLTLGWVMTLVQRCAASMERLNTVLGGDPPAAPAPPLLTPPAIDISGLNFGYENGRLVLRGINLVIPAGSVVGIVGPTGSGKSTLLRPSPDYTLLRTGQFSSTTPIWPTSMAASIAAALPSSPRKGGSSPARWRRISFTACQEGAMSCCNG
jgi:ATP-binding cassette subfamily B protein